MLHKTPDKSLHTLAGVPVHYSFPGLIESLRTKPLFYTGVSMTNALDACFRELWNRCPLGPADTILSSGTRSARNPHIRTPNGKSPPGETFYLIGFKWGDMTILAKDFVVITDVYLGIEAVLRKHFGSVKGHDSQYDLSSCWHIDNSSNPGFNAEDLSCGVFLQLTLARWFDRPVQTNGLVGTNTLHAAGTAMDGLGLIDGDDVVTDQQICAALENHWVEYLDFCAGIGLSELTPNARTR